MLPWQKKPQREATGSGFVLSDRRIVTNAHVVADQNWIQVRKHGSHEKVNARTRHVNHECDLALLEVADDEFWEDMPTLELGDVPNMQDRVLVAGYPSCGDNLCVTSGVVSRVEPQQYCHGASSLLAVQIDAAINPGNSGGPAFMDGKVAGVAFQSHVGNENCGFIIPVPIIEHFLEESRRPACGGGFCSLGVTCQATENADLRAFLRLPRPGVGVLVNKVRPLSPAAGYIKPNDVLIAFDGHEIGTDGTINWRGRERISFDYLISMKYAQETCEVTVWRDGAEVVMNLTLWPEPQVVPVHQYDKQPQYFIAAGLVFCPLIQPYLHEFGDDWYNRSPRKLCDLSMNATLKEPDEQIVVLTQVLTHQINLGYSDLTNLQVVTVDNDRVRNLRHFVDLYESAHRRGQEFIRIGLDDNRIIVINLRSAHESMPEILHQHRVPADRSPDLAADVDETPDVSERSRRIALEAAAA